MKVLRAWYWALFIFWFRFDLFTKRRENRFWKAVVAMSVVQLWVIGGVYILIEILGKVSPPGIVPGVVLYFALTIVNTRVLRRAGWEHFDATFDSYLPRARTTFFAVGALTTAGAFAFVLIAGIVLRGPR